MPRGTQQSAFTSGISIPFNPPRLTTKNKEAVMADAHDPLPRLLSIPELAEHLGVTERHIRRLISERRIPYVRWRRFIRFDPAEITVWLKSARYPQDDDHGREFRSHSHP
jgi:excisionase family DNA binding protein